MGTCRGCVCHRRDWHLVQIDRFGHFIPVHRGTRLTAYGYVGNEVIIGIEGCDTGTCKGAYGPISSSCGRRGYGRDRLSCWNEVVGDATEKDGGIENIGSRG